MNSPSNTTGGGRVSRVIRDVHFWIPVIVLVLGLFVLQWIR